MRWWGPDYFMKLIFSKSYVRPHVRSAPKTGKKIAVRGYENSKPHPPLTSPAPPFDSRVWWGVDLDRTLAHYETGQSLEHIGHPIPAMIRRVREWIKQGRRVKIFTARAEAPDQIPKIQAWLVEHGLPKLEITNRKDHLMEYLYDDKARQIIINAGKTVNGRQKSTPISKATSTKLIFKTHSERSHQHVARGRPITQDELRYYAESADIKKNQQTAQAQKPHSFTPAKWTHKNGHPRCLLCGDDEPASGVCDGFRKGLVLKTHISGYTKQDGTYVRPHEDTRPAAKPEPPKPGPLYYSKLERLLEAKLPNAASAEQIRGILNSGGVSKEEIEWSGLLEFLAGKAKVTKPEVLDFIKDNQVELKEVVKRTKEAVRLSTDDMNRLADLQQRDMDQLTPDLQRERAALTQRYNAYLDEGEVKFNRPDLVLPGGTNYREQLFILPAKPQPVSLPAGYRIQRADKNPPERRFLILADGSTFARGAGPTKEAAILNAFPVKSPDTFHSTHFDEPNIVAHVRATDRTGPNGEKILFVEEVQSDLHQQGKKRGYQFTIPEADRARLETIIDDMERMAGDRDAVTNRMHEERRWHELAKERDILLAKERQSVEGVPNFPFKNSWHELAMKRMLREAAEKGYDSLSWITGDETAKRYDLSKHIAEVRTYKHLESSPYSTLVAINHQGKNILEKQVADTDIENYVGKQAAEKLLEKQWTSNTDLNFANHGRWVRSVSGLDLKIGGEWAINLYDQMIPQFMDKFTKKWGGQVEAGEIDTSPAKNRDFEEFSRQHVQAWPESTPAQVHQAFQTYGKRVKVPIHILKITPAMRESVVREGVPLFKAVPASKAPWPKGLLRLKRGGKGGGYRIDYKTTFQGLPVTIENRKGSIRRWKDLDSGEEGQTKMEFPYGYIRGTEGLDGDHVDCFLGPNPEASHAYIVHQLKKPDFVQHDEDKVMLGWDSPEAAAEAYIRHFNDARFLGSMTIMPMAEFKMKVAWTKERPGIIKSLVLKFRRLLKSSEERWITVHPGGPGSEGQPVKIRESKGSPGTFHVIAGAGGKLNYMRLTGVKSHEEYKAQAKDRAKEKRTKAKEQLKRDKDLGLVDSKKQVLSALRTDTEKHQRKLVEQVAELKGWTDYDLKPEQLEGLSDRAKQAAILKHHRQLHRDALAVVRSTRDSLLLNAEARAEAELGELSIHRDEPNVLGLTDLSPDPKDRGLGYQPEYGPKTDEIEEEARDFKAERAKARDPKQQAALEKMQATTQEARDEVDQAIEAGKLSFGERDTSPVEAKHAVKLLMVEKETHRALKDIHAKKKEVQGATTGIQAKSYVIPSEPVSAQEVLTDLTHDAAERIRQDRATSFLKMVEHDPFEEHPADHQAALTQHIQAGSSALLSRVSQQLTGVDILPREVVDVLGTAGAAQALALAIHQNFPAEQVAQWTERLGQYHAENQGAVTEEALGRAKEAYEQAQELVAESVESPSDLAVANELNEQRITLLRDAREALGTTLGELEAIAALQFALQSKPVTETMVSMGGVSTDTAIRQLKAIGLDKDDYDIDSDGTNHFALISGTGLAKVVRPIDPEEVQHLQTVNAILAGEHDEEGWVPHGFADRPSHSFLDPEHQAVTYAQPYRYSEQGAHDHDLKQYIGQRMADGHAPHEIYKDLYSGTVLEQIPPDQHEAYFQAVERIAPLYDEHGKAQTAEAHRAHWERMAEETLTHQYGEDAAPIHKQGLKTDSPKTFEAIHRVIAEDPTRGVAFTRVGDLTPQDQATLRHVFETRFAKQENQAALTQAMEELGPEPAKETDGLFGTQDNPAWHQYQAKKQAIRQEAQLKGLSWEKYVRLHGSREHAYQAIQDVVKGEAAQAIAKEYGRVHKTPLKLGRALVTNNLAHLDAVNPDAREGRLKEQRELVDRLRNRTNGKYAGGGVRDKLDRARELSAITDQNQRAMFSVEPDGHSADRPLHDDERHTLGQTAEAQLASLWPQVSRNFDPQRPVSLMKDKRMDGKFVNQQRAIKYISHNKRVALALGTGSGKTSVGLGAFTHLHSQGNVKRGIFSVPSIVQAQFGAEAAANLAPGKYSWWGKPGADREARIAALKDPAHHMVITTHQSLRDDLVHLMAKHKGVTEDEMAETFQGMKEDERSTLMQETLKAEGIDHQFFFADESHDALDRKGKPDSLLSTVLDAFHGHLPYYISSSADPLKNDLSELYSQLKKIDPNKFSNPAAFMAKYGLNTNASQDVLRRELRRYLLPGKVDPGVQAIHHEEPVSLSDSQQQAYDQVMADYTAARIARQKGTIDLDAAKRLSPSSFEGKPEAEHAAIAEALHGNLGITRDGALERVLNDHEPSKNAKVQHVLQLANTYKEQGKPGIMFARSRKAVDNLTQELSKAGHRVISLTGSDSAKGKGRKIGQFRPPPGRTPEADVMVLSDAGATGADLQRGKWIVHYDQPHTSKTFWQRTGRIHRLGQTDDVHVHTLVTNTKLDAQKQQRINRKHGLRAMLTAPYEALSDDHDLFTLLRDHDDKD